MDDFFKMDVFFVITTAVVLIVGAILVVVLYYLARVLQSVDRFMKNVAEESDSVRKDIADLRMKLREEGMRWKHFSEFVTSVAARHRQRGGGTREKTTKANHPQHEQ